MTSSLVGGFVRSAKADGVLSASRWLAQRLALVAVPVLEVLLVCGGAYALYAAVHVEHARKHSLVQDGTAHAGREAPRDIMKPHFFQNRQGLWLHHWMQWEPKFGPAKGVVVLLHGHSEHSRRFHHVAQHLNEQGLAVFAMDHQGFGRSEGDRGHVEDFDHYIVDVMDFLLNVVYEEHEEWRALPRFLLGHSFGGLVAVHTALACQESANPAHRLNGIVVSGPALKVDPSSNTMLIRTIGAIIGYIAPKAPLVGFPSHPSTTFLQVKHHGTTDPLNYHGNVRVHQGLELLRGTKLAHARADEFKTPLLVGHGVDDKHCDIDGSRDFVKSISSKDKTLLELPNIMHEPMQEEKHIRDPILKKYSDWILTHLEAFEIVDASDSGAQAQASKTD